MQSSDRMKIKLPNGSGKSKRVAVFCPPAEEPEAGCGIQLAFHHVQRSCRFSNPGPCQLPVQREMHGQALEMGATIAGKASWSSLDLVSTWTVVKGCEACCE